MKKPESLTYCPCCGVPKPNWDYPVGASICTLCAMLDVSAAVHLTRETVRRELNVSEYTLAGRKAARVRAKLDTYAKLGKRCTACHNRKPADEYHASARQCDGLQPMCKACNKIWIATMKSGGPAAWHAVRAAMRAASPEGK